MKKSILLSIVFFAFLFVGCDFSYEPTPRDIAVSSQKESAQKAVNTVTIPNVSYFQERRTVAKWIQRWDKPNVATYVYLLSYGNIIGYYVADGKPASTRSYLMPEESVIDDPNGSCEAGSVVLSTPDIDGTYGENNPGIRFFTAEGVAVEWGGSGASYLYSDAPLPINAPKLNVVIKK